MRILILISIILLNAVLCSAQESIYKDFNIYTSSGKVYITCTIQGGNTCNGITLYRSTDSLIFNQIEHLPGVCGNTDYDQKYTFIDNNPIKNARSWYKFYLGGQGYTEALSLEYYDISAGLLIRTLNTHSYQFHFNNPLKNQYLLNLYSLSGLWLQSIAVSSETFALDTREFGNQMLLFELVNTQGNERYTGKLLH